MRLTEKGIFKNIDWIMVLCWFVLFLIGWLNIYASIHSSEPSSIFSPDGRSGKQFIWMLISLGFGLVILFVLNPHLYESFSLPIYLGVVILLVAVIFLGTEVKGSRSWFELGPVRFQPAEVSKISTSLLLATLMSQFGFKMSRPKDFITVAAVILLPMLIIVGQSETGSALVYVGFAFVLYREGMSGWVLFIGIMAALLFILTLAASPYTAMIVLATVTTFCDAAYSGKIKRWFVRYFPSIAFLCFVPVIMKNIYEAASLNVENMIKPTYVFLAVVVCILPFIVFRAYRNRSRFTLLATAALLAGIMLVYSTDFLFNDVLQEHQRKRIEVLLGLKDDPSGVGYNVNQSMIAIGSGGFLGKGYLQGTQTTYGFVPEQSTDFIFCTIGEEWGFLGSSAVILLYVFLIWRIITKAERCKEAFTRIYGYCVASCIFMHLFINIGMTVGLMPVIGIPLPFISYGGSSLLAFTIMLFIFIALESNEKKFAG